ncbi:MAG TPA: choline dehydrogenase [Casimicrobiaceae bacterium]|nr:choline dehydrogenase [Casimicrobiaceae bacterium]
MSHDYVIVGAGTAGCVLANRLSADARSSVLLLEAGPTDAYPWIHIPIGYAKTMFHPRFNWRFYTEPEPLMNGRKVYWPRGKTLGGSSSINGLISIRGQPHDYDRWAAAGNPGWSFADVLPHFKRLEHAEDGDSRLHGRDGPVWCSRIRRKHELIEAVIAAGSELGLPRNDDFNGTTQEGVGYYHLATRRGWRCSGATAYLKPARGRANLRVETDAQATRVTFQGKRATGVLFRQQGQERSAAARKAVILCAGALQTPQLLQLSGVGPAPLLRSLSIPIVHELPGVGENLQDHLQARVIFQCSKPITTNDDLMSWWRTLKIGLDYVFTRGGPMAVGINQGGIFARVKPDSATPDVQFHVATLSSDMAGSPTHPFSGFTFSVCQLRPESRGFVRIKSADPLEPPAMQPNYLSIPEDCATLTSGIRLARRLAATRALAPYVKAEYRPGPMAQSDAELLEFVRNTGGTIFHPAGTCKMGDIARDPRAVVDARLRVHGMRSLRVVDCSIMPTLTSGNTNVPVVMIAEKAADMILDDEQD